MSWSIQKRIGLPERLKVPVTEDFDRAAKYYEGTPEAADVKSAKNSVLAWLDSVQPGYAAIVEANGSRGSGWLTIKVECSAVKMEE